MTKTFPYGRQETYLFNELPYLVKAFKKVLIVPYDEFRYDPKENRITDAGVEVFNINAEASRLALNLKHKINRELQAPGIILFELLKGREFIKHIKFLRQNLSRLRHSYSAALCLKDHLEKTDEKNILFYNYWLHGGVIISNLCARLMRKKIPVVSRAHAYDVYHQDWYRIFPQSKFLFLGFETWKVHHTDHIYPISQHGYNHFLKVFPGEKNRFSISRLGVIPQQENIAFPELKPSDRLLLVTCSNTDHNKRIYRMPEILSKLNRPATWVHFGGGNDEDITQVKTEIEKYGLQESCILKGFTPNKNVLDFYRTNRVDLILNLSRIEGIPVSLMEAASFGIPMLATETVGNPEIVNNDNGFLIGVEFDSDQVAQMLNNYFAKPEEIRSKRKSSLRTFEEKYNASKNYPQFIESIINIGNTGK